jgi:hypothetical protein
MTFVTKLAHDYNRKENQVPDDYTEKREISLLTYNFLWSCKK